MFKRRSIGDIIFDSVNTVLLIIVALIMLLPFYYVIVRSLLPYDLAVQSAFTLFPKRVTFEAYKYILSSSKFVSSLGISAFVTVIGTVYQLFVTIFASYAIAKKSLPGRKLFFALFLITMFFNGGLIANYLLMRGLHLINSVWSLIAPFGFSCYNMLIMKSFFEGIPADLEESASIDGANTFRILFSIIMPLSVPVIATFALFFAVDRWNGWYNAMIYINDKSKWPFVMILREILISSDTESVGSAYVSSEYVVGDSIKMAVVIVSVLPVAIIYPFIQKYFVKGVTLGAVKG